MRDVAADEFQLVYDPSVGEDERWYVNDHCFFRTPDGAWHLIGITHAEPMNPFDEKHLAHATAPALLGPWTKQPFALSADGAAGETQLWAPHVVEHDGLLWMFYCAGGAEKTAYRLHAATSTDGFTWTRRDDANPLVVDGFEARDPMVRRVGDRWAMYYTATEEPSGGHHVVVATFSDDLAHWSGREIVYRDPMTGTMAGPTESPFVLEQGGRWYLLIGPDWAGVLDRDRSAYRRTRVLASDDPFHFELAGQVATIEAHAAEVIEDEEGARWVSHCGWGQGGVWLARHDP